MTQNSQRILEKKSVYFEEQVERGLDTLECNLQVIQ